MEGGLREARPYGPRRVPAEMDTPGRRQQIALIAYFKAARRGFAPGRELQDWLEAEREYEAILSAVATAVEARGDHPLPKGEAPSSTGTKPRHRASRQGPLGVGQG